LLERLSIFILKEVKAKLIMIVSIIIPTYKDWTRLSLCLAALKQQTYKDFEVIVVNNDEDSNVPIDVSSFSNLKLLHETTPGSYAARNTGLRNAKGHILGFTDSDCIPEPNWIENAVKFFESNPQISRIAGHIELFYSSKSLNLAELYESVYAFRQDINATMGISVTGNMFSLRTVFDNVGDFNSDFLSGGDNEWSLRANGKGYLISYVKDVVIKHPARNSLDELKGKAIRVAGSQCKKGYWGLKKALLFMLPPLNSLKWSKDLSLVNKVKVLLVKYYLNISQAIEILKVKRGKQANRF